MADAIDRIHEWVLLDVKYDRIHPVTKTRIAREIQEEEDLRILNDLVDRAAEVAGG